MVTRTRTPLGDYITTSFIEDSEHVTIECTQPLRLLSLEPKGKSIYERPVDVWSGVWDVKKIRSTKGIR